MTGTKYSELRQQVRGRAPIAAVVLGSGLNQVADDWPSICTVSFTELPGLRATAVAGHPGQLSLCEFTVEQVLVFQGRLHFYEGHAWEIVERPVRIAFELGARTLILTNAAGGIGPRQEPGTLMAVRDQIAAMSPDWWRRAARTGAGLERPSPYSPRLLELLHAAAYDLDEELFEGVYAAVTGPSYETPAEIRSLEIIGADAVGMSTAPEAKIGHSLGMEVAAISCIANRAAGLSNAPLSHAEVLSAVRSTSEKMKRLLVAFLSRLRAEQST